MSFIVELPGFEGGARLRAADASAKLIPDPDGVRLDGPFVIDLWGGPYENQEWQTTDVFVLTAFQGVVAREKNGRYELIKTRQMFESAFIHQRYVASHANGPYIWSNGVIIAVVDLGNGPKPLVRMTDVAISILRDDNYEHANTLRVPSWKNDPVEEVSLVTVNRSSFSGFFFENSESGFQILATPSDQFSVGNEVEGIIRFPATTTIAFYVGQGEGGGRVATNPEQGAIFTITRQTSAKDGYVQLARSAGLVLRTVTLDSKLTRERIDRVEVNGGWMSVVAFRGDRRGEVRLRSRVTITGDMDHDTDHTNVILISGPRERFKFHIPMPNSCNDAFNKDLDETKYLLALNIPHFSYEDPEAGTKVQKRIVTAAEQFYGLELLGLKKGDGAPTRLDASHLRIYLDPIVNGQSPISIDGKRRYRVQAGLFGMPIRGRYVDSKLSEKRCKIGPPKPLELAAGGLNLRVGSEGESVLPIIIDTGCLGEPLVLEQSICVVHLLARKQEV